MSLERYILGAALTALIAGALGYAAVRTRGRLFPGWSGAPARLVDVVLALAALVLLGQALGVVGLLTAPALCVGSAALALASGRLRKGAGGPAPPAPGEGGRWAPVLAGTLLALQWTVSAAAALRNGMSNTDSLWYHMPFAAKFAQEGSVTGVHLFASEPLTTYYPANASLLHAAGILLFDGDLLSPLLNLAWPALGVLAGWCIGRRFGAAPAAALATAVVFALPVMAGTQAGEATNDAMGLALLLAAAAVLVSAPTDTAAGGVAGLAAGLALGTKLTLAAPALALGAGAVVLAGRGRRLAAAARWSAGLAAGGGVWYARNLFVTGNPLPWLEMGPLSLPSPPTPVADAIRFTVLNYLTDADAWGDFFLPSLSPALGPVWPVFLAAVAAGVLAALLAPGGDRVVRVLGAVAAASLAAYAVTPQSAGGLEGSPGLFLLNTRFATAGLALALVALPLVPALRRRPVGLLTTQLLALLLVATVLGFDVLREGPGAAAVGTALLVLLLGAWALRKPPQRQAAWLATTMAAIAVGGGWAVQQRYLDGRYRVDPSPLGVVYAWASGVARSDIAVVGMYRQYPLFGADISNRVDYLARRGDSGTFKVYASCDEWRAAVARGGYRYVVTAPLDFPQDPTAPPPPEARWTESDPAARRVLRPSPQVAVFRLAGRLDPRRCPR